MTLQEFRDYVSNPPKPAEGRNSMGCSESFYDPRYLIRSSISDEDIMTLTEREFRLLYDVAAFATEVFY